MLTLTVPASLAPLLAGPAEGGPIRSVQLRSDDWPSAAVEIGTRFPRLAERVLTGSGTVRPGFLLVVNGTVAASNQELPRVRSGDDVFLLVQLAGG